jgi:Mg-chelatase subunit ChlD
MSTPQSFICPITLAIMDDPWSDTDGNTYEKDAIIQWIEQRNISPITRNPMSVTSLVPNRALKDLIQNYLGNPQSIEPLALTKQEIDTESFERDPVTVIMIADTSGSMDEICSNKNSTEVINFTRLDLVKHTMKTIIESLSSKDEVAIVQFNSSASAVTNIVNGTKQNKSSLIDKVNSLRAEGGTNIWDALRVSIELAKTKTTTTSKVHLLLFTDGESNENPPRGIIPTLKDYIMNIPSSNITLNTFGFGNNINSDLLYQITREASGGIFGFIPDSTMIGTVFVNSLAHLMTNKYTIELNPTDTVVLDSLVGILGNKVTSTPFNSTIRENLKKFITDIETQHIISKFVNDIVVDCKETMDENFGQISKAFEQKYFDKWGKHYLFSVLSAYQNKFCLNFKDSGVQNFKTQNFEKVQKFVENIFVNMEPPVPTGRDYYGGGSNAPISSQQFTQTFYNQSGGCFVGDSLIKVIITNDHGNDIDDYIKVNEVTPGTRVVTHNGTAMVKCVVRFKFTGNICQYGTLGITEYHPVFFENIQNIQNMNWQFPVDSEKFLKSYVQDEYVYDFILDKDNTVELNGVFAVTLNHEFTGDVVGHDYFGTNSVQDDLMKHHEWNKGYITLDTWQFVRNPDTNRVESLVF